ncbi:MAG: VOC family protein [Tropicimonas sp.]|uniref:VOC family protein n=1 Tax=Tropicimonas sp. TaxID=2067044 RepID=UPI003A8601EC
MSNLTELDHFAWATPDLAAASARFAQATGVTPAPGGSHPGKGTQNALAALGPGLYLAIDGPDPAQPPEAVNGAWMRKLAAPSLRVFVARTGDIDTLERVMRAQGFDTRREHQSRIDPEGREIAWEALAATEDRGFGVTLPVFCQWQSQPHPAEISPQGCRMAGFNVTHPDADGVRRLYDALELDGITVAVGPAPTLRLRVLGGGGEIALTT